MLSLRLRMLLAFASDKPEKALPQMLRLPGNSELVVSKTTNFKTRFLGIYLNLSYWNG